MFGFVLGVFQTAVMFKFIVGEEQGTLLQKYLGKEKRKQSEMVTNLCRKLGVDENLDPDSKMKQIVERMDELENLKNTLKDENKKANVKLEEIKRRSEQNFAREQTAG